ncbi:MAG: hypothetical protein E7324_01700 [Clostridiales bacterium]|nr:hypothetical protein [Clostridiales bacterium]
MSFRIGAVRFRIHGVLPFLWIFSLVTGSILSILPSLIALILHEGGHLAAAKALGMPPSEIEITPYGGVMSLDQLNDLTPLRSFLLASAGPACSLFGCLCSMILFRIHWLDFAFFSRLFQCNLLLMLLNLLPVLPLDGGRMLQAVLSLFLSPALIRKTLSLAGGILGIFLISLSIHWAFQGRMVFTPAFAGAYIIYAAAIEQKSSAARYITGLIGRRQRLSGEDVLKVCHIAVAASTPLTRLLPHLQRRRYHRIVVLSPDGMTPLGMLEENEIVEGLLSYPQSITIQQFFTQRKGKTAR